MRWKSTRSGVAHLKDGEKALRFVVRFSDTQPFSGKQTPALHVTASRGRVLTPSVQRNPPTGGLRATFVFDPGDAKLSDLRANLDAYNGRTPETWVCRWTR